MLQGGGGGPVVNRSHLDVSFPRCSSPFYGLVAGPPTLCGRCTSSSAGCRPHCRAAVGGRRRTSCAVLQPRWRGQRLDSASMSSQSQCRSAHAYAMIQKRRPALTFLSSARVFGRVKPQLLELLPYACDFDEMMCSIKALTTQDKRNADWPFQTCRLSQIWRKTMSTRSAVCDGRIGWCRQHLSTPATEAPKKCKFATGWTTTSLALLAPASDSATAPTGPSTGGSASTQLNLAVSL